MRVTKNFHKRTNKDMILISKKHINVTKLINKFHINAQEKYNYVVKMTVKFFKWRKNVIEMIKRNTMMIQKR